MARSSTKRGNVRHSLLDDQCNLPVGKVSSLPSSTGDWIIPWSTTYLPSFFFCLLINYYRLARLCKKKFKAQCLRLDLPLCNVRVPACPGGVNENNAWPTSVKRSYIFTKRFRLKIVQFPTRKMLWPSARVTHLLRGLTLQLDSLYLTSQWEPSWPFSGPSPRLGWLCRGEERGTSQESKQWLFKYARSRNIIES